MSHDTECPYCGLSQEINHDDGYGYEEGEVFNQECAGCGKTFAYITSISFHHEALKAPCLNNEPHNWKDVNGFGYNSNRKICSYCGCYRM